MREQQAVGTRDPDSGGDADVPAETPAWTRLEQQIGWYERKSDHNQHWFKGLKIVQIVTAAAIPVAAAASAPAAVLGGGGALIVVLEGVQQLQQYQQNWITYRSTCERLKHEKFLLPQPRRPLRSRCRSGGGVGGAGGGARLGGERGLGLAPGARRRSAGAHG